jgi:RNA polymerase sigma-70 factor (ECF subfamily)
MDLRIAPLSSRELSQSKSFSTMSESATHDPIEAVVRDSYGRLVAYIAARTGDIADAQDALCEALVAALENWPTNGVPDKPEAWLLHVARSLNEAGSTHHALAADAIAHCDRVRSPARLL